MVRQTVQDSLQRGAGDLVIIRCRKAPRIGPDMLSLELTTIVSLHDDKEGIEIRVCG